MLIECVGREWAVLEEPADRTGKVFYSETDKNIIVFSWNISFHSLICINSLKFLLLLVCVTSAALGVYQGSIVIVFVFAFVFDFVSVFVFVIVYVLAV